jgi:hypothetical protein
MDQETALRIVTKPIGAAIILAIISLIIFCCSCAPTFKSMVRFFILTVLSAFAVIYINNHYLIIDFDKEQVISGTFKDYLKTK